MGREHRYRVAIEWTGNRGSGTAGYRAYDRSHAVTAEGKPPIAGSSDPAFRGDPSRYSPEDLLVASLSACHMLWYLHLCAEAGVAVTAYRDDALGVMREEADGGGRFVEVVLKPAVTVRSPDMVEPANRLHAEAHRRCFIANSVSFLVRLEAQVEVEG
ncbi:MAG TPA: OsmC family protein, partial [Geminicoccaceae bacterium]|nr:OsmC family protein [Geminicoccaceae bacterium]